MRSVTAVLVLLLVSCSVPPPQPTPVQPPAGEEARVLSLLGTSSWLGAARTTLDEYRTALIADLEASSKPGVTAARKSDAYRADGRLVDIANNTRVLVLEHDVNQTRVRVLDGPNAGREGWVYSEGVIRPGSNRS